MSHFSATMDGTMTSSQWIQILTSVLPVLGGFVWFHLKAVTREAVTDEKIIVLSKLVDSLGIKLEAVTASVNRIEGALGSSGLQITHKP